MKKVTLIGCGNIGSRHLQGLVRSSFGLNIDIVDPSENSKSLAQERLKEVNYDSSEFEFNWYDSIDSIEKSDFVILATPSTNRIEIVSKLLEKGFSRFVIEKMVCQSSLEYDTLIKMITENNASRRYFDSYNKIKGQLNSGPYHIFVNCGNEGLGSNAIHFIDLFSWLTDSTDLHLDGSYLQNKIYQNKRGDEFVEFAGTIIGNNGNGSNLSLNFFPFDNLPMYVGIFGPQNSLLIDESQGKLYNFRDNTKKLKEFTIEFQSTLTTKIVKDILEKDYSLLPTLEDSYLAHIELFRIFNTHIKKISNKEVEKCPIT